MAIGGRSNFEIDFSEFEKSLKTVLHHVDRGTKKATKEAAHEILENSLSQVPRETNTLARSAYVEIHGKYRNFEAEIGYGGHGDPQNPNTGQKASEYMVAVHEDLSANHPQGKAKFLEDPVREYQAKEKFLYKAAKILRDEFK